MNHPIQHHIQQWGIIAIFTHQESVKAKFLRHSEYEFILAEHVFLLWVSVGDFKTPGSAVSALSAE